MDAGSSMVCVVSSKCLLHQPTLCSFLLHNILLIKYWLCDWLLLNCWWRYCGYLQSKLFENAASVPISAGFKNNVWYLTETRSLGSVFSVYYVIFGCLGVKQQELLYGCWQCRIMNVVEWAQKTIDGVVPSWAVRTNDISSRHLILVDR